MLVPLYAFVSGDSLGLLLLVQDHDTIADVADNALAAAAVRVPSNGKGSVSVAGRELSPALTVLQAGLAALDRIDVVAEGAAVPPCLRGGGPEPSRNGVG